MIESLKSRTCDRSFLENLRPHPQNRTGLNAYDHDRQVAPVDHAPSHGRHKLDRVAAELLNQNSGFLHPNKISFD
jgi:hypothetical protein